MLMCTWGLILNLLRSLYGAVGCHGLATFVECLRQGFPSRYCFGELCFGKRKRGTPYKRWKDCIKEDLKLFCLGVHWPPWLRQPEKDVLVDTLPKGVGIIRPVGHWYLIYLWRSRWIKIGNFKPLSNDAANQRYSRWAAVKYRFKTPAIRRTSNVEPYVQIGYGKSHNLIWNGVRLYRLTTQRPTGVLYPLPWHHESSDKLFYIFGHGSHVLSSGESAARARKRWTFQCQYGV